jgi:type I restriction enzyme S subunit
MSSKAQTMTKTSKRALTPKLRFPEFRGKGEWEARKLGSLTSFLSGGTPSKDNPTYWNGSIPWVSASSMYEMLISEADHYVTPLAIGNGTRIAKKGSLLILVRGSMLFNRVPMCIATLDVAFNQDVKALEVDASISSIFLINQLSAFESRIPINETGIGAGKIELEDLKKFQVFIPSNAEQHRIADCLSSLDDLISAEARALDALKIHKNGLMQQLFPREGETTPRLRFPEFRRKGKWEEKFFGDLLDDIIDFRGRTPTKLGMEWGCGNITSLSANNVKNGFIDYSAECNLGSEELYSRWMGKVNLEKEDIIFTMEAPMGNALLLPDSIKYILSQRVVAFKTKAEVLNPFLVQLIWSEDFQNEIAKLATGSTAKGINQKALKIVPVRLPSPHEQHRIADCLTSLDDQIAAQAAKIDALKTHKRGLMQQLFPAPEET